MTTTGFLGSHRVMATPQVKRGEMYGTEGGLLWMHPLDLIAAQHRDNAHDELDAAVRWVMSQAEVRFLIAEQGLGF